ncbi:MAG: DUF3465 domain-containing protein [Steroidobacteraceae bacterium]
MLSGPKLRLAGLLVAVLGAGWYLGRAQSGAPAASSMNAAPQHEVGDDAARSAFEQRSSGRVIVINGDVERVLADDRDGSPHQRFIVRTRSGLSVLIAHNLDLAPRLQGLAAGDRVTVLGQYEWNEKGGVMHWTHGDPAGRHTTGYIEWHGRRYQ